MKLWLSNKPALIYLFTHKIAKNSLFKRKQPIFNSTTNLCTWQRLEIVMSLTALTTLPRQDKYTQKTSDPYKVQVLPVLCSHWEQLVAAGPGQSGPTEARIQVQLILSLGNEVMRFK